MVDQAGPLEVAFVDASADVRPALSQVAADVVGVDVERADADRYHRRAALVQVGIAGRCVLLDGVSLVTLPELDRFLGDGRVTVLHAVENDLAPLAAKGVRPARPADTAVAAAVLGLPTGLGALLAAVLDVELDGDKGAYQRADWEARPLSEGMAAYAAGDVVHLPALWSELAARLTASGRTGWYEQELDWTMGRATEDTRDWSRVKGAGKLAPAERAVLRAVWEERERLARKHDIAPNRLLHDEILRTLAVDPPRTEAQLVRRSQRRRSLLRQHATELLAAIDRGRVAAPEGRDGGTRRWSERHRTAFDAMRRARSAVAEELGIDAGILCPSRPLWSVLAGEPRDGAELCSLAELRPWQADLLREPLWQAYREAMGASAG
jgi:ribonuclease D